jgi:hypothetical protein
MLVLWRMPCKLVRVVQTTDKVSTAIPIIIEGQFQVFQLFSSSKLVLEAVESCFVALNYYGKGSGQAKRRKRQSKDAEKACEDAHAHATVILIIIEAVSFRFFQRFFRSKLVTGTKNRREPFHGPQLL